MVGLFTRRKFLSRSVIGGIGAVAATPAWANRSKEKITFRPDRSRQLFRVRSEISVEGNVSVGKGASSANKTLRQVPVQVQSTVDYEERLLQAPKHVVSAGERYYYEASSQGTLAKQPHKTFLRSSAKRVAVHCREGRSVQYGLGDYLTPNELDLLRLPVNSLAIDELLPTRSIALGETYKLGNHALRRVLDLDGVQRQDVIGKVISDQKGRVVLKLTGSLEGSFDGVPTTIDLAGKLLYDQKQQVCSWLVMAIREQRQIGNAEPGFEVATTIKMIRKPLKKPNAIKRPASIPIDRDPLPEQLLVNMTSRPGRFSALLDRTWRVIAENPTLVTLRQVQSDRNIAHCDLRMLSPFKAGQPLTLEAFQADVQRSLGDTFGEFVEAEETVNDHDLRVLRVFAAGMTEGGPMHWIYVHFSDDSGRRILATLTQESSDLPTVGETGVQLAGSLRFLSSNEENDFETNVAAKSFRQSE